MFITISCFKFCEYPLGVFIRYGASTRVKMELQEERDERKTVRRPIDPFQYNQWRHYGVRKEMKPRKAPKKIKKVKKRY